MSLALYRKYRPSSFSDVVGQQVIVDTLKRQVSEGRVAHAYLFTGSRGTGKTSCAKILAKAVNCLNLKDGDPCGECVCCRGVDDGSLTDVLEIDAASNNGVDSIRVLREEAFYTPAVARYRVYIIDEVHMLSSSAFNALLKIMEEPPEHVIFILSTTEIHKVLPTIISRCQRYDFKRIDSPVIASRLMYIAEKEGIDLTEDGAVQIARLSDGALRDALSLLDVCRAHGDTVNAQSVAEAAGLTGDNHLFEMTDYFLSGKVSEAVSLIDRLSRQSLEPGRLCEQLIGHMRALMLVKTVSDPLSLIGCMPEHIKDYKEQANKTKLSAIMRCLSELGQAQAAIARTAAKRMELELAIVKICVHQAETGDAGDLLDRLQKLEKIISSGAIPQQISPSNNKPEPSQPKPEEKNITPKAPPAREYIPEKPPKEPLPAAPVADEQPAADDGDGDTVLFDAWEQVLLRLESINRMNAGLLKGSRAYISGRRVLIDCDNPVFLDMIRTQEETRANIKKAITLTTGQNFGIGPYRSASDIKKTDPLEEFIKNLPQDGSINIK